MKGIIQTLSAMRARFSGFQVNSGFVLLATLLLLAANPFGASASEPVVEYVHTDAFGTPLVVTDANGNVVETYEYEPYGLQISGPVEDGPGYTGHVEDAATGLTYMQQRYYEPQIGMFLSVDPVTAYDSPIGQFHRYRYANGNPYKYTDPDGREGASITLDTRIERLMKGEISKEEYHAENQAAGVGAVVGTIGGAIVLAAGVEAVAKEVVQTIVEEVVGVDVPVPSVKSAVKHMSPKNLIPTQTKAEMSGSQVKQLAKDMKQNGFDESKPIVGQRNGVGRVEIIDGHHRTEAAKQAGIDKVPVEILEKVE